jgi:hypothetical protein
VAEVADLRADALGKPLQALAHQLVIVAPQRVARHVAQLAVLQHRPGVADVRRRVVHAHRNHSLRARLQLLRSAAFGAVARHVVHLAVVFVVEPLLQVLLVARQVDTADAGIAEAQLAGPLLDRPRECDVVDGGGVSGGVVEAGHGPSLSAAAPRPALPIIRR